MLFDMLEVGGLSPSIISGAGLTRIIKQGKIGNAVVGQGEWLVIEADESDGSIVNYHPEIGLLLNVDKDHDEITTLLQLFEQFQKNSVHFSVNRSHSVAASLSLHAENDFAVQDDEVLPTTIGYKADHFFQQGISIQFTINKTPFELQQLGRHNMENALAAAAVANQVGVSLETCAIALKQYQGIYRRHQILGTKNGVIVIDDYAHNPAKCAAAISACHPLAPKVIAWFQPHGYKPTRFLRADFVASIANALRPEDEIWMSEIYYAGGTAVKDISAGDLINDLLQLGVNAYFEEDRSQFTEAVRSHLTTDCVLLLMGARDPSLEEFSKEVFKKL
jgi:UDP-N-acetylmuramate--alanine ligase